MKKRSLLILLLAASSFMLGACSSNKSSESALEVNKTELVETTPKSETTVPEVVVYKEPDTKEKDSFVLYSLTYRDGKNLGSGSSSTIEITSKVKENIYNFKEHVLSCGTHMTGTFTEIKGKDKTSIKGDFNVTRNSFDIKRLIIDIEQDNTDTSKLSGTFIIDDGKPIDVNSVIIPVDPSW